MNTYTVIRPFSHAKTHYGWGETIQMDAKEAAPLVKRGLLAEQGPSELDMSKVLGAFDEKQPKKKK